MNETRERLILPQVETWQIVLATGVSYTAGMMGKIIAIHSPLLQLHTIAATSLVAATAGCAWLLTRYFLSEGAYNDGT